MRKLRMFVIALATVGAFMAFASNALAAPAHPSKVQSFSPAQSDAVASPMFALRGQCGGRIHSVTQYINNLAVFGAVPAAANVNKSAGYSPTDGSFTQWLKDRVIVTRLAAPTTIKNYGCNANGLFYAGMKRLPKGWPVLVALPSQYSKSDIRTSPSPGRKAVALRVHLVAQASCTNPGQAVVIVIIYVVKAKVPPKQPPATGNCNAINSPGAIVCSTVTVIIQCGNVQVAGSGNTIAEATKNAQATANQVCGSIPQTPPACSSNCGGPPPTCEQTHACQPPPTCQQTNTCPPPVQHSCSLAVQSPKSGSSTVNASVTTDVSPSSVNINWGDGSSSGGSSASHTYPTPAPSPVAGDGVNYTVSATANFGSQSVFCGSQTVFIPSPPPNGNGGPPPPPPPSPNTIEL